MMNRRERITQILEQNLQPQKLEVIDESHTHSVPEGGETHFKVICVSGVFSGLSRVDRQRKVHSLLGGELSSGLHALSLQLFTREEWGQFASSLDMTSPACHGGSKRK